MSTLDDNCPPLVAFFLEEHRCLAAAVAPETGQEPHVPAAVTHSTHLLPRKAFQQLPQQSLLRRPQHLLGATHIEALDEHPGRHRFLPLLPLQKVPQLLLEAAVHGHVTLAEGHPEGLKSRPNSAAGLEGAPHSPQGGGVDHHSVLAAGRAYPLEGVQVLFLGGGFGFGFWGREWEWREAEAVGVEAFHQLPGVDDLWRFGQGGRGGGGGGWVKSEEAIGGGCEGHDVVANAECGGTQLGEVVFMVEEV
ncbi:uncharacterized protein DS421_13g388560 [Arachis hypogaea]|nr:uncharacterized protein DS421_13g388560 [Arachis hypogaea]